MTFPSILSDEGVRARNLAKAVEAIAAAKQQLRDVRTALTQDINKARAYLDPDLSGEGLVKRRQELETAARTKHAPTIDGIDSSISDSTRQLTNAWDKYKPVVNWTDPASIQRAQAKWDQARMRLDAGIRLEDVTANADLDTLAALAEWAPAWLDTQHRPTNAGLEGAVRGQTTPPSYNHLHSLIDDRVVQLLGDPAKTAHDNALEAKYITAYATPILTYLQAIVAGKPTSTTALDVSIAAHYAEQEARGRTTEPEEAGEAA